MRKPNKGKKNSLKVEKRNHHGKRQQTISTTVNLVDDDQDDTQDKYEEEPLLSPELLAELGGDACLPVLTTSQRQKRQRPKQETKEETHTEDEIAQAKKVSKRARKKLDQIKAKKERESKRNGYLEILQKYSITDEQQVVLSYRQLMIIMFISTMYDHFVCSGC